MKINLKFFSFWDLFAFLLPSATILTQWFSVGGINISWVLYIALFFVLLKRYRILLNYIGILGFILAVSIIPFMNFLFGIAGDFPLTLYFSLITGLVVLLYVCVMTETEYKSFTIGLLVSCVLFSVWGIYEIFTGNYLLFSNASLFKENWMGYHYPGVAFANTNDLVQYLVLLFPLSGWILLKKYKWLFALVSVLILFNIYHSGSKMGMISLCVVLFMAYVVGVYNRNKASKKAKMLLIGLFVIIILWILDMRTGYITSIFDNFLKVDVEADYFTGRNSIYTELLLFALKNPLGGFGSSYLVTNTVPHNLILFILCDYGWLPFAVFISVIVVMTVRALHNAKVTTIPEFWCMLFAALCLFVLTSSISSCNEQRKAVWIFLAICIRNIYISPIGGCEPLSPRFFKITLLGKQSKIKSKLS